MFSIFHAMLSQGRLCFLHEAFVTHWVWINRLIQPGINVECTSTYIYISYINFSGQHFVKQEQLDPVKEEALQKLGMPMESLNTSQVATRIEQ